MREIVFDTETTGLDPREDRVIEIGGVELVNRFPTGRTFHVYINPAGPVGSSRRAGRARPQRRVPGATSRFSPRSPRSSWTSSATPRWSPTMPASTSASSMPSSAGSASRPIDPDRVVDTLALGAAQAPEGPNSLDALCRRYGIDNSRRTKHGALLDSELLAEVYIELIGGKQAALVPGRSRRTAVAIGSRNRDRGRRSRRGRDPLPPRLTRAERAAHARLIASSATRPSG